MKTVSKKLLCLLMAVFLLAAAIPFQAFADDADVPAPQADPVLTVKYTVDGIQKTLTISEQVDKTGIIGKIKQEEGGADCTVEGIDDAFSWDPATSGSQELNVTVTKALVTPSTLTVTIDSADIALDPITLTEAVNDANVIVGKVSDALTAKGEKPEDYTITVENGFTSWDATADQSIKVTVTKKAPAPVSAKITVLVNNGTDTVEVGTIDGEVGKAIDKAKVDAMVKGEYPNCTINSYDPDPSHIIASAAESITVKITLPTDPATETYTLTLNANGGKVEGNDAVLRYKKYGEQIGTLPVPTKDGFVFVGWYTEKEGGYLFGTGAYNYTENKTVYAHWSVKSKELEVFRVLNGSINTAKSLFPTQHLYVPENQRVLDYLRENVSSLVQSAVPAGYSWDGLWRDYALKELTQQDTTMEESYTAYVNFTANKYKIVFEANGGKVDPASMEVTFDKKVGTLPTPTKDGKVFKGWFDDNGNRYTADTVYRVAGNITLYANWEDEAFVLVRFYLNGETKSVDRIIDMTKYVEGDNITREAVEKIVKKYYSAQSGKELRADGLYTASTWADYVNNTSKKGTPTVQIKKDSPTYVYVMVRNAKQGGSSSSSTSTKPVDKTNPKTGDTMAVYSAMSAMVLTAAALMTVQAMRKKKQF